MSRIGVLAALLVLPALLAGCGGNSLLPPTTELTPDKAPDTGGGSAYPTAEDTASTGPERFNPFADPTAKPAGGREVIENPTPADIMVTGTLPEDARTVIQRVADERGARLFDASEGVEASVEMSDGVAHLSVTTPRRASAPCRATYDRPRPNARSARSCAASCRCQSRAGKRERASSHP